jgi:hypothetical protein
VFCRHRRDRSLARSGLRGACTCTAYCGVNFMESR